VDKQKIIKACKKPGVKRRSLIALGERNRGGGRGTGILTKKHLTSGEGQSGLGHRGKKKKNFLKRQQAEGFSRQKITLTGSKKKAPLILYKGGGGSARVRRHQYLQQKVNIV